MLKNNNDDTKKFGIVAIIFAIIFFLLEVKEIPKNELSVIFLNSGNTLNLLGSLLLISASPFFIFILIEGLSLSSSSSLSKYKIETLKKFSNLFYNLGIYFSFIFSMIYISILLGIHLLLFLIENNIIITSQTHPILGAIILLIPFIIVITISVYFYEVVSNPIKVLFKKLKKK